MRKILLVISLCAGGLLPTAGAGPFYPGPSNYGDFTYHALVIGVDRKVVKGSGSTCHVPFADKLAGFLKKWKCFQKGGVAVLKGGEATKRRIMAAVTGLRLGPKDVLVLYYGGHGDYAGIAAAGEERISPDELFGYMRRSGAGFKVLLVSACYSGIFSDPDEEWSETPKPGFAIATSGEESGTTTFGEVGFGPYLWKLLNLKFGSAHGAVTLGELADFMKTENAAWKKRGKTRLSDGRNYGPKDSVILWN